MSDAFLSPPVLAAVIGGMFGLTGAILSFRASRKVDKVKEQLSQMRFDPYRELWSSLAKASLSSGMTLTPKARSSLLNILHNWYTENGNGIFLSLAARDVFDKAYGYLIDPTSESELIR